MGQTITVRLPKELAAWIEVSAATSGLSQGEIVRHHLEHARGGDRRKFMRLAGAIRGTRDLSTRKGFSKT